ncbi:hypothetical protein LPJ73_007166, partial [Coemansia sp. RSA 2703]
RSAFRVHAAAACAIVRALRVLADTCDPADACAARLRGFATREAADFTLVWQLLEDAALMVSPGELRAPATRLQILDDVVDAQWLRPLSSAATAAVEQRLPNVPQRVATLAAMLSVSRVALLRRVAARCVDMRRPAWALDACAQMLAALRIPVAGDSQAPWADVLRALDACERRVAAHPALVRRMLALAQSAARACAVAVANQPQAPAALHDALAALVDMHARWDLAAAVLGQTTAGDFALLTRRLPAESSEAVDRDIDDDGQAPWLAPLFAAMYVERGLVMPVERAMPLVGRMVAALRRLPAPADDLLRQPDHPPAAAAAAAQPPPPRREGKMADTTADPDHDHDFDQDDEDDDDSDDVVADLQALRAAAIARCRDLVAVLAQNRHWLLAVQALQLTVAQLARSAFSTGLPDEPSAAEDDALAGDEHSALALLRQRLAGGGLSDDELHVLLAPFAENSGGGSGSLPAPDVAALVGRSLVRALQQPRGLDAPFV